MSKKEAYGIALNDALVKLDGLDLDDVVFNSSTKLVDGVIELDFLGSPVQIKERGRQIIFPSTGQEAKISEKIILLHYLITADGSPLERSEVAFESIPGASFYAPTYKARTTDQLVRVFKNDLGKFVQVLTSLKARVEGNFESGKSNQVKIKILALPCVPITFVYWKGDPEVGPSLQILYDTSITKYLPLEDMVVLTELLTHKVIGLSRA